MIFDWFGYFCLFGYIKVSGAWVCLTVGREMVKSICGELFVLFECDGRLMSEDEYLRLLDRAVAQLPKEKGKGERFEMPRPNSQISGSRTILFNLKEICDRLKRNKSHLLRYLAGELATSATVDKDRAIFQGKFDNRSLDQLVERYVKDFVLCPVCHQPDTKITRKDRIYFLVCEACGASSSIRGI